MDEWSPPDTHWPRAASANATSPGLGPTMELPLVAGDVRGSVRQVGGMGATATGAATRVGRLAEVDTWVVMDVVALEVWSIDAEVKTGRWRPAGTEATTALVRVEAGAETLSEAVVSGAGAAVAGLDMEAGAETVETGGEEADRVGQGGEAIPAKDSDLWDPSPSMPTKEEGQRVSFCYTTHTKHRLLLSHGCQYI